MKTHPEPEQLSAYLDDQVEAAERAQIETHLQSCAECSGTITALRATVAELRELPSPTPSEQDSWALRAAVTRARKLPAKRYQRWVVAAGSVAAAAIAIVLIIQPGGESNKRAAIGQTGTSAEGAGTLDSALISIDPANYNEKTASQLLAVADSRAVAAAPLAAQESTDSKTAGTTAGGGTPAPSTQSFSAANDVSSFLPAIQNCEGQLFADDQTARTPVRYIVARFKNVPAFFLLYSVKSGSTTKTELWVVQRKDCFIRYYVPPQ